LIDFIILFYLFIYLLLLHSRDTISTNRDCSFRFEVTRSFVVR